MGRWEPPVDRFWKHVDKRGAKDCWPWLGSIDAGGYGTFWSGERQMRPHRFAYEQFVGPIPVGLDLDHICHTRENCAGGPTCQHRRCVNPAHLAPATRSENLRRGHAGGDRERGFAEWQRAKTHCPRGHEYTPENTYAPPSRPTARYCRQCHLEHTRERRGSTATGPGVPSRERTHCPQGHPYDDENTYRYGGRRYCRTCIRERRQRLHAARLH